MPGTRHEPEPRLGDDGERSLAAAEQPREVVAGVVLLQPVEAIDDRAVRENCAQADDLAPHRTVPQHVHAARVRRHHAADGCAVAGAEVDAEVPARGPHMGLHARERGARAGGDLRAGTVDRSEGIEAAQVDDDLAGEWNRAADEAGVPALRDDRDAGAVADANHSARPRDVRPGRTTAGVAPRNRPVQSTV